MRPSIRPCRRRSIASRRRCLEKQPAERFHSAHDLAIALEAIAGASHPSGSASALGAAIRLPRRTFRSLTVAAALVVVAVGAVVTGRLTSGPAASTAPNFWRLTFRRGPIFSARLAPDAATIIYSGAFDGFDSQLYATRRDSPDSLPLPYARSDVVAISSKGEMAIVAHRRQVFAYVRPGTLARAPLSGGASRDVLEDVQDADWLPDGSNLVVTHSMRYTERLADAGIAPSVGSRGDAFDNALAESVIGLYKTEVIARRDGWRSLEAVEFATLRWVDWFNHRRLLGPIGFVPPAEHEAHYYQQVSVA